MLPGNIEQFKSYSQFQSLEDFNETMTMYMGRYRDQFTKGERRALFHLTRFCAKVPGVSNIRLCKLLMYANQSEHISRSTFERMLRKATGLGMLTIHHTLRKEGGYSHNVYVFNRIDGAGEQQLKEEQSAEIPDGSRAEAPSSPPETINLFKTILKDISKDVRLENLDESYCPSHISKDFIKAAKPFYGADGIYQLWGTALIACRRYTLNNPIEHYVPVIISAFKQTVFQYKKGNIKGSFKGYFYGTLVAMFNMEVRRETMHKLPYLVYDWLGDSDNQADLSDRPEALI
ncbi:hypothetical protein EV207_16011 [Scopulibacillus darangshiensis]|uniref:Uncharacterized protein n=1 Tax=Scopulibacillus darangshiensis TaxID=442528 RepID=A0A4R2NF17_9BACL|nr:hypothetical protein [Scopulibacillus darangshiensis]TCP19705.1 hypothetical protein EV207_16011 [Scopulibacillus darangshiensis]